MKRAWLLVVACSLLACGTAEEPADLVLMGGRIVTMDASNPEAEALAARGQELVAVGSEKDVRRLIGPETDLRFSVAGRTWVNSDGHQNMPSGEVFTSPVDGSAEGTITYDYPVCDSGREIDDIRLVFRKGRPWTSWAANQFKDGFHGNR